MRTIRCSGRVGGGGWGVGGGLVSAQGGVKTLPCRNSKNCPNSVFLYGSIGSISEALSSVHTTTAIYLCS